MLLHVLLALAVVVALGRVLGLLFVRLGQPPVIGEVVAGILLGPSLLGRLSPDSMDFLLPRDAAPHLVAGAAVARLHLLPHQARPATRATASVSAGVTGDSFTWA